MGVGLQVELHVGHRAHELVEALDRGGTAISDHHEAPDAIDGSLSIIAEACAEVGVRVSCAYGITDRHGPDGARRGLAENERFLRAGGRGMVGVHDAFNCTDESLEAAAGLAADLNVGVHVHVAEGKADVEAADRLRPLATDDWLLIHGVHLDDDHGLAGTVVHNPRSNMNNSVGYARPARFANSVALGTDGIGADMLDEFRLAYVRHREDDVTASPEDAWGWLAAGWDLFPEAHHDRVIWDPVAPVEAPMDPWRLAFTTGVAPAPWRSTVKWCWPTVEPRVWTPKRSGPGLPNRRPSYTSAWTRSEFRERKRL